MSQASGFSLDLFPLDSKRGKGAPPMRKLDTGEPYLKQERILSSVLLAVQPCCEGPLSALRATATSLLMQETGMNVGYGWQNWRDHTLREWLSLPVDEWVFGQSLAWEVTIGLTLWLAALAGAPQETVTQWHVDFLKSASEEAQQGDFSSLRNDGQRGNIPTLDALVSFFRDSLLNRMLEQIPKTRERFRASLDPSIVAKMREWTIPPKPLLRYCLEAEEKPLRHSLRDITLMRDNSGGNVPAQTIVWAPAQSMSHYELVDIAKLPTYYFGQSFASPLDADSIPMDSVQMFLPAAIEGPTNGIKAPESFNEFMDKYYKRLHILEVDSTTHASLFHLITPVSSSRAQHKKEQGRRDALKEARARAFETLRNTVDELEPSAIAQANVKAIVGQWFADIE